MFHRINGVSKHFFITFNIVGQISQEACNPDHISVPPQPPPTTPVGKYAAYLRKVYLRSKLPIKGKWPPSPCKKIIKLAAIEKKQESNTAEAAKRVRAETVDKYMMDNSMTPVSLDNLLVTKDGSPPKAVVVQGAPGIGKSTFAWKFCRKWAKGKLYQNYQLVVLLRMRDRRVREATKLTDLFSAVYPHDPELTASVTKDVLSRGGKGVLLLFEGLDELPCSLLGEDSLLLEIMQGLSLPEVTLVVTSRPWAVQTLIEKCGDQISRRVEILGFTKEDISRYVSNAFCEEEKNDIMEYLHTHPQLEAIMHIPLNAAFVVQIYKECKRSQQAIPQTMTQLYSTLVQGLLLRHMKSIPEFSNFKLIDFKSLPEPFETSFRQLCLLAFMSFTKHTVQVTFTDSESALYGCLDSLGLMQSSADLSIDTGTTVTHSFLHFTIQEFLAAYHLSLQSLETQALFFETHSSDPHFAVLLGFLIGLNSSFVQNYKCTAHETLGTVSIFHWLYESQSPKVVSQFLGKGFVEYASSYMSPFDIYTLTYCLCHSNCMWELVLGLEKLTSVFPTQMSSYVGQINRLGIINVTGSGLEKFCSLPQNLFLNLRYLLLYHLSYVSVATKEIAKVIKKSLFSSLEEFSIGVANGSFCGVGDVVDALRLSCPRLIKLNTKRSVFTPSDMLQLCEYISSPTILAGLSIVESEFQEDSLQLLISAIPCAKSLLVLDLSFNQFHQTDVEMLSVALSVNSTLKILKLMSCSIDGEGAEQLATGLEDNHFLEELNLDSNDIDTRSAAALSEMLVVNTSLKKLSLKLNKLIGVEGAIKFLNALEHNNTLQTLLLPPESEPVEYQSFLMNDVRESGRVNFHK